MDNAVLSCETKKFLLVFTSFIDEKYFKVMGISSETMMSSNNCFSQFLV